MKARLLNKANGVAIAAVMFMTLTKGVETASGQVSVTVSTPPATVVVQNDYVYYPHYGVYYDRAHRVFCYPQGNSWVTAPAPVGVTAEVVLASPSVHMDFHDTPAHHHDVIIKKYPKDWKDDRHDRDHDKH
jgi:hypothetical protein